MLITKIQTVEMKKLKRDTRREIIKQEKLARDKDSSYTAAMQCNPPLKDAI